RRRSCAACMRSGEDGEVRPAPQATGEHDSSKMKPSPIEGEDFSPEARRPRRVRCDLVVLVVKNLRPPTQAPPTAGNPRISTASPTSLPLSFQTHRTFRGQSSRLRKDRPHNAPPVFDNRTPPLRPGAANPNSPKAPMCAPPF